MSFYLYLSVKANIREPTRVYMESNEGDQNIRDLRNLCTLCSIMYVFFSFSESQAKRRLKN
jgi:hypothetical protein